MSTELSELSARYERSLRAKRRGRLLFVAAVATLLGAVVAGVAWNLARAWGA